MTQSVNGEVFSVGGLRRRYEGFGLGLTPLIPGWIAAFAASRGALGERAMIIGGLATGLTIVLGVPVWEIALRTRWSRDVQVGFLVRHAGGAAVFVVAWIWLQYALNPFRVRGVADALMTSQALPWQAITGFSVYLAFVAVASIICLRNERGEGVPLQQGPVQHPPLAHIPVRIGMRTEVIPVSAIQRLEGCDDYVAVFADGRRVLASERLSRLANQLDGSRFVRVHRSHIVNLDYVRAIESLPGSRVRIVMRSGDSVTASRAGTAAIRAMFRQR
ncbi:MAG: LytTR family DNA-binding domain-containing protein [Gemmatimonadota bacterium]